MKILRVRVGALVVATGLALLGAGVTTAQATKPAPEHKVTLCHRTGSDGGGNTHAGYSIITVDIASVANEKGKRGHDSHEQVGNGHGGDIIPAYTYKGFKYEGKNLGHGGQAILDRDCKTKDRETHTTKPPKETETTSTSTSTTSTSTSSTSTTATTPAETTTTTVAVAGTSTSAPTSTTAPVSVLGAAAEETNPLPSGAAAGQANSSGQLAAGGLAAFAALLALGVGLVLRRRHGEI